MQELQERLQASWEAFGPQVVGAIIIMAVAYILALVVRAIDLGRRAAASIDSFLKG